MLGKVPVPLPNSTAMFAAELTLVVTMSGRQSPLKSANATEFGPGPAE